MTDHTTRDPDVPPAGSLWCSHPGGCHHAALPEKSTLCPVHAPEKYAPRMDPFVAPKFDNGGNVPPAMTPPEEDECSPSARLPISTQTCDTTSTDDSADSTGPDSVSATRLTQLWTRALDRIAQQAR